LATPKWYANGLLSVTNGNATAGLNVDYDADTIKLMLVTSAFTPNQATNTTRNDFNANEATGGSGYPTGGFTLGTKTASLTSLTLNHDAADISQAIVGGPFAFRYGIYYKSTGGAATTDAVDGVRRFRGAERDRRDHQHHPDQPAHHHGELRGEHG
jgi:hypothetical protein